MLEEAKAAESDRDFISKCCIGLKEARESWIRLRILAACGIGPQEEIGVLIQEAGELISILTVIVRHKRQSSPSSTGRPSKTPGNNFRASDP
jgi:four helix bundle protein